MAKELPYFRFTASEWLNDDISLEPYEIKGLFADICAFYWFRDCSIDLALLQKKFSDAGELLDYIINLDILKLNHDNTITIKFLDEQFDLLSEKRKKRSEAGRIGGLRKSSNAKAMLNQKPSYNDKDKDKEKDKNKINIDFDVFWNLYNKKVSKVKCKPKWDKLTNEERQKIIDTLPAFISNIRDKQYQPNPETYFNQRRWDDEIELKKDINGEIKQNTKTWEAPEGDGGFKIHRT